MRSGEPITGVEVNGQRPDGTNVERVWVTYWHPLKSGNGEVIGINVAAEEITERKRAEAERTAMQDRLRRLNKIPWRNVLRQRLRNATAFGNSLRTCLSSVTTMERSTTSILHGL